MAVVTARAPFQWVDGPLVTAMRQGDIILIDELNLAEDAVLERMNRHVSSSLLLNFSCVVHVHEGLVRTWSMQQSFILVFFAPVII